MTQRGRVRAPPPIGVVYHTSMNRPDAALALAALYVFDNKREARVGAVCVGGSGLDAAIFCDVVARLYITSERNSNQLLPIGLAAADPIFPSSPMVRAALERTSADGEPLYRRTIQRVADTAMAEAILRNGVVFNAESAMVLSAPATWLARALDLPDTLPTYATRVRCLVIVDTAETRSDPVSLERVIAVWPSPVFFCGSDVGDVLRFPGARLDDVFRWAPEHPVVDAYRAFQPMPYDAPAHDLAAIHYAVHPDSDLFDVSGPGSLSARAGGVLEFTPGEGNVRRLSVGSGTADRAMEALIATVGAVPEAPVGRGR